jgi:antitoxin component of MazEF toxin-antitoxin module
MIRRLFKTGNSIVLSLPRQALQSLGLEDGSDVQVEVDISRSALVITPYVQPIVPGLDAEFSHQVEDFLAHYRPALEELNRS